MEFFKKYMQGPKMEKPFTRIEKKRGSFLSFCDGAPGGARF